jgi:hypothetical protein
MSLGARRGRLALGFGFGVIALLAGSHCSAIRTAKERQSTAAEANLEADTARVYGAALAVLPEFHLIATGDYAAAGFIEARGDWGSPSEGAFIQIAVRAEGPGSKLVVEAGRSADRSRSQMRDFARTIRDRIVALLSGDSPPAP